ncbi:MAG: InlB B-repeat-containing protein [Clostridia bacterium]|nr:InlB B-repeat-containing protein [Clostridia bacterium]
MKKKTILKVLSLVAVAAIAFTVVHFAVTGNNTPTDSAFTFAVENGNAILTGCEDALSGAVMLPAEIGGNTVTGIGDDAFKDCSDVTAFFLPDTITSIGSYAFENCTSLAQMILPNGLTTIGEGAFWKCSSLLSVTVPTSVAEIGSCAFYKCDAMESLIILGADTPVRGIFNVALDIGQTISIGHVNGAHDALDPITTTIYCYKDSVAYYDALEDSFSLLALLNDCEKTAYTVRYTDETGADVAPAVTLNVQPVGIHVAAVAPVVENTELQYPDPAIQTAELVSGENVITFVYASQTYTVIFDAALGEAKEQLVYSTVSTDTLGDTTRTGYTFLGWQVSAASEDDHYNWGDVGTLYAADDTVTGKYGDVTLTALWQGNSITVTYDGQGGTPAEESKVVTFGDTYGELTTAEREGYTFDGWYTDPDSGSKVEATMTVSNTEDHAIYARWIINEYNVTVTNDGNGTAEADLTADVAYDTLVTLTAQANPGFAFSGWESDDVTVSTDNTFRMPDKAVSVKATFTAVSYTVTFDTDGGDAKGALTYKTTEDTAIGSASKAGYTLIGWDVTVPAQSGDYNWGDAQTRYTADDTVSGKYGDVTLKAVWQGNGVTVTYNAQGGTPAEASKTVTVGDVYGELTTAEREGYTFDGWYTAANGGSKVEATTTVSQTADHEIFAYWIINKYDVTVTNDGNGTAEADLTTDVAYDTLVTLTAAAKPGYAFSGWESDDVAVGADNTFRMPDKAVAVKATFTALDYTVTFDTDGGEEKTALTYKTTDDAALGTASKAGYTFLRWTVTVPADSGDYNWGNAGTEYGAAQAVTGKYGDVTLKAVWAGNNIKAIYDAQGGSVFNPHKVVTVGGVYGVLLTAEREGYTFDGWFTAAEGGDPILSDTAVTQTADHTIYAHWTINKYVVTVTTDGHGTAEADLTADVAYDTVVTLTATPAAGYTFSAWESRDVAVGADNTFRMPDKAVAVKAVFAANAYVIAFDANGGENTMEPIDAVYDTDVVLTENAFEKTGFEFLGWGLTADAEAPVYEDGATVSNLTDEAGKTVTLYAVWKDIKVELIAREGSTTVIDEDTHYIYGLKTEITEEELLNNYLDILGNGSLVIYDEDGFLGTGDTVDLINDNTGEVAESYTLVIFGDVTGDGRVTSSDVTEVRQMSARLKDYLIVDAFTFAANLQKDEIINSSDVTLVRQMAARLIQVDQVTREYAGIS